jgi:NitT/TauT family transport system substrate-binding protein
MQSKLCARLVAVCVVPAAMLVSAACSNSAGHSPAGSSEGSSSGLTTVSYSGVQEQGASGYVAADRNGFFARQGLKFSPTWATSGPVILEGVVSGTFDVGNVGPAQLYAAIENGICARVLRATEGAAYGLISRPSLHLDTGLPYPEVLKQLRGRTIGVPALGGAQQLVLGTLLKDAGLDPDRDVSWIAIGVGATAITAFVNGDVDAAVSYSQLEVNLQANGTEFDKLLDLSGSNTPLGSFWQAVAVANCDWADSHHDTVMKFCHALNQGFAALAHDPAAGPAAFLDVKLGSNLDQATTLWAKYKAPVVQIPPLNERNWSYQAQFNPNDFTPEFSKYVVDGCAAA